MQLGLLVMGATLATNLAEARQEEMESEGVLQCCDGVQDQHDPKPPLQQEKPRRVVKLTWNHSFRTAWEIQSWIKYKILISDSIQMILEDMKRIQERQKEQLPRQYLDAIQDTIQRLSETADDSSCHRFVSYTDSDLCSGGSVMKRVEAIRPETQRNHAIQTFKQVIEPRCLTLLLMMLMPACLQYLQLFRNKKQICKGSEDITSTSSTWPREKAKEANQATRRQKPTTESVTGFCRQPQVNWSNVRSVLVC